MDFFKTKRHLNQSFELKVVICGIISALLIWTGVALKLLSEREAEIQYSIKIVGNLTRAFEEHILRTITSADQVALFVKRQYERSIPVEFSPYLEDGVIVAQPYVLISIADENGNLVSSSQEPFVFSNIADREHFNIHKSSDEGQLYISRPVLGRSSGKWSIQMTRRINKVDGAFGGVVVVSIDPFYFTRFYKKVDLGDNAIIAVMGRDGFIRAWQSNDLHNVGKELNEIDSRLMREILANESGYYIAPSEKDGIMRLNSYQSLYNNQLIIYIGIAEKEILNDFYIRQKTYHIIAFIFCLIVCGVCYSIIRMKRLEQEVLRLDRLNLIGEMAAGIGHEVRNPMTTVRGFLQVLKNKYEGSADSDYFNIMIDEIDRANAIITEYLTLAKGKMVERKIVDLNYTIKSLLPLLQADALMQDKEVVTELGEIPELLLDEKEIRQLILNIVRNGLEAMTSGGKVTITTFADNLSVVLSIKDEGKGIDKPVLHKVGTPFFTTKESGTGLGLAICYSIVARHDATINIETSPGGTTFIVRFRKLIK